MSVNPGESKTVPFIKKNNLRNLIKPTLFGNGLQLSTGIKCLVIKTDKEFITAGQGTEKGLQGLLHLQRCVWETVGIEAKSVVLRLRTI
jgi:hypothetical protein